MKQRLGVLIALLMAASGCMTRGVHQPRTAHEEHKLTGKMLLLEPLGKASAYRDEIFRQSLATYANDIVSLRDVEEEFARLKTQETPDGFEDLLFVAEQIEFEVLYQQFYRGGPIPYELSQPLMQDARSPRSKGEVQRLLSLIQHEKEVIDEMNVALDAGDYEYFLIETGRAKTVLMVAQKVSQYILRRLKVDALLLSQISEFEHYKPKPFKRFTVAVSILHRDSGRLFEFGDMKRDIAMNDERPEGVGQMIELVFSPSVRKEVGHRQAQLHWERSNPSQIVGLNRESKKTP